MSESGNVLITGVSTGIGYACCKVFIASGYRVFGSVRTQKDADRLSETFGEKFTPLIFDVTDHEAIDLAAIVVSKALSDQGLDCLINNAGVALGGPMMHVPIERLREQFEVNVIGLVKVTQAFLPLLGARAGHIGKPGRIINISSVVGQIAMPFLGPYVGSKHALEGISQVMRRELMHYGIDVVVVGPGAIKTPIWNKGMDSLYEDTAFARSLQIFAKGFIRGSIKHGFEPGKLALDIFRIFKKDRPKPRYAIVAKPFLNWWLPKILPTRMMDRYLAKKLEITR
ncbi:SDR family NAD(P)-dependent oxidoreductase [Marinoscillum luteum]|uniref:SDR family NAD(P)-dependent oxidoreductase n=1 Tax=Marinoscillum luteum TaxID=861051 RepID=A0ABW7N4X9_9BACT